MAEAIAKDAKPMLPDRVRVQMDRVSGKPVLLYPEGVLVLNPTGHAIVLLCNGQRSIKQIASDLALKFSAPVDAIRDDVVQYVERLRVKNLIEFAGAAE